MDFLSAILRPYLNILNLQNAQSSLFGSIAILFTAIAFYQAYRGFSLALSIRSNWLKIRQEPLTNHKKRLAENASFFIAVPPGVLLHELGHAIFVWLFGGRVVEFGFFFFWGYVLPDRFFAPTAEFIISSAGTWMNLVYALLIWLFIGRSKSTVIRYFGLRAIRFQIFFALIYYPLFTLALPIGDWRTIYDFSETPLLSGITAVAHALLLLGHWTLDRYGYYDIVGFASAEQQEAYEQQMRIADENPHDLTIQDEVISQMIRGGAVKPAQRRIRKLLKENPQWADGHLTYALTLIGNNRQLPQAAVREIRKALDLGLSDDRQKAIAHNLLGQHYVNTEQYKQGIQHLTDALGYAANPNTKLPRLRLEAYYWRGEAKRRQGNQAAAVTDLQEALALAQQLQQTEFAEQISKLLDVMNQSQKK